MSEARAIAAVSHPHICQIFGIGTDYLVLEFVAGAPLQGPLAAKDALRLATQVASALEAAHECGVLHRDLKPANILLTKSGIKLLDFGLAKLSANAAPDMTASITGNLVGTPAYMSPEQAQGKSIDARSDVFSFGAVLYELLSGKQAFHGETMLDLLNAVVKDEPVPLDSPAWALVKRCLAKDPAQRFQTAGELRQALEAAVT